MIERTEIIRLGLSLSPAMIITAIGCLFSSQSDVWVAVAQGGGIALLLLIVGGSLVATTSKAPLHMSAAAALASFIIRIGGAGVAAYFLLDHPNSTFALGALAGCLFTTLALDMWTWSRVAKDMDAPLTHVKESARA